MKTSIVLVLAGLVATPALAQQGRTVAVDGPRYEATRSSTYDRDERSLSRGAEITRKSDGATAHSTFERQRTEDGVTRGRATTDFAGRESSSRHERRRTAEGWESEGQHVRRDGRVADYTGHGTRTDTGYVAHQTRAINGQPAGSRTVERTRAPRRTGRP